MVIIITGASSGIGRATAVRFAQSGAAMALIARRKEALAETAAAVRAAGGKAITLVKDLTREDAPRQVVDHCVQEYGRLDVLVNNAGVLTLGDIQETTLEEWDRAMNINLRVLFQLTQAALPHLIAVKGNVVNVSSVTGTRAFPGLLAYCVSKAAVDQFTRCVALEMAPFGVRVNAVNPGVVETELHGTAGLTTSAYTQFLERSKKSHPLGRTGKAEEIAALIHFLSSTEASWMTGGTYAIDGGRGITCAR